MLPLHQEHRGTAPIRVFLVFASKRSLFSIQLNNLCTFCSCSKFVQLAPFSTAANSYLVFFLFCSVLCSSCGQFGRPHSARSALFLPLSHSSSTFVFYSILFYMYCALLLDILNSKGHSHVLGGSVRLIKCEWEQSS